MIANLIQTIILAFGVATGNVSSNVYKRGNSFNHELQIEKQEPTIKKAIQNFTINESFDLITGYSESNGWNYKYYLDEKVNYTSPLGQITNTSYSSVYVDPANTKSKSRNLTIIRIDPYRLTTNNTLRVELTYNYYVRNQPGHTAQKQVEWQYQSYATTQNFDEYIDLTAYSLIESNPNNIYDNLKTRNPQYIITSGYDSGTETVSGADGVRSMVATLTISELSYEQPIWIIVKAQAYRTSSQYYTEEVIELHPSSFYWSGQYIESNYEVIDLPGTMLTILTMPFTFYSTAFNLTIFPGTPYALNFGNLILTIVGALILFYLIKKII